MENKLPYVQIVESAGNLKALPRRGVRARRNCSANWIACRRRLPVARHAWLSTAGVPTRPACRTTHHGARTAPRFLAGRRILKAATGEVATEEERGGAENCTPRSRGWRLPGRGTIDDAIVSPRDPRPDRLAARACRPPRSFKPTRLRARNCSAYDDGHKRPVDMKQVIAASPDESDFLEFGEHYARQVCGHVG